MGFKLNIAKENIKLTLRLFTATRQLKPYIIFKPHFQILFQGFTKILVGEMDHLPEIAFYMVGPIEEVAAKAETLAKSS